MTKSKHHLKAKRHNGKFDKNSGSRRWLKTRHRIKQELLR